MPPFTHETATQKVRMAEDGWNGRDPDKVVLAYSEDTVWRNRVNFPVGREQAHQFLRKKWATEHEYRLIKELWAYTEKRFASINDLLINKSDRKFLWPQGKRPDKHPSLTDLGL